MDEPRNTDDGASTDRLAERIAKSVNEQLESGSGSRRRFLSRAALGGGVILALGGSTGTALADEGDRGMTVMFDDVEGTDVDVLKYALALERLENAFYDTGIEMFSRDDFDNAEIVQEYSTETDLSVYDYVRAVGEHEAAHVRVLEQAVTLLGGDPGAEASYDFGISSVEEFLGLGKVFENTGVAAYAGAAPFIQSPDLLSAALSIHSVEARHAAFFNDITGESFFPNAFDSALSQQEVLDAVSDFIESTG